MAAPSARQPKRLAGSIGDFGKRLVTTRIDDAGIMELVAA